MLKRSYGPVEISAETSALAEKITSLVAASDVTYKEAMDVLETVLVMLETRVKLSSGPSLH